MHKRIISVAALLLVLALAAGSALANEQANFERFPRTVDYDFVSVYAKMPRPQGVLIIDSRPYKPKYVKGFIPSAVSIPASQLDKLAEQLPADKNTLLIFYCGGLKCPLSHKSAFKARELGYRNVHVYDEGFPDWKKKAPYHSVGVEMVKEKLVEGENYLLVDARPTSKFLQGSIPSAVSIPQSKFEDKTGLLPADKNAPLIYFCGGFKCPLSHKSAMAAAALGYTDITVADAGYPGWKELYGASGAVAVQGGEVEGSIDIAQFEKIMAEEPDSIMLVDVRDPGEYAAGHMTGAVNIPVDKLEKQAPSLSADKPIVFVCASGARSGEAYYMIRDMRPDIEDVYYIEGESTFHKDGSFEIKAPK